MKQLLKSITPKQIFRLKKPRSVAKSEPQSFNSASYSSSSSTASNSSSSSESDPKTLRSVAPPTRTRSEEIIRAGSDSDWSDNGHVEIFRFDFVEAFKMIDRDGDGKITRVELESFFRRVGGKTPPLTEEELEAMIKDVDRNGDGCISLEELETVGSVLDPTAAGEEELREAFDFFDADHDGKITAEELHAVFLALGDERCTLEDCRRMIEGVDKNGDGFVCFEEFARMMDITR